MYPPKVRDLDHLDRSVVLPAIKVALCPYCTVPFLTDREREEAFILQYPTTGNLTFFIHEECFNVQLKYN